MSNPVLAEVTRGPLVESLHRGALHVVDADGRTVLTVGDVDRPIFPRSAMKALQALPLVESGAPDKFALGDAELAIACASHNGEPEHTATSAKMLAAAGRDASALECGWHWPTHHQPTAHAIARAGATPTALHNNCSGKHAGFVCLACATGADPRGYVQPTHPVQRMVAEAISDATGHAIHDQTPLGADGCSAPNWALPLRALALGFARFGTGQGLGASRARAATRLRAAVAARPDMVAGSGRLDTNAMRALGAKVFMKVGAEGVYCASFPGQGLGVALKIDDGATRAAEVAIMALIARFVALEPAEATAIAPFRTPEIRNWNGILTGQARPAGPLA